MDTPEKLYLSKNIYGTYLYQVPDNNDKSNIEYTRTDAFIEKACKGIKHLLSGYIIRNFHFGDSYEMDTLIEDFKNYVKGE